MPIYSALTIGPIFQTIQKAKTTRSIWAASYLFSYIIEQIANDELIKSNLLGQSTDVDTKELPAGLYPDRLVVKKVTKTALESVCSRVLNGLYDKFYSVEAMGLRKRGEINPLKNVICLNVVQKEFQDKDPNIMEELHHLLDVSELEPFYGNDQEDILQIFFNLIQTLAKDKNGLEKSNDLLNTIFGKKPQIKSIFSISGAELSKETTQGIERLSDKKQIPIDEMVGIKNYHKYVAVVQADGDNIGKTIKALFEEESESEAIGTLADLLMRKAKDAVTKIINYGGLPIYAGGDDLLFFAPVINNNSSVKNIFALIDQLSYDFEQAFRAELFGPTSSYKLSKVENLEVPTLSFGLSITYYKYPLSEAIERSGSLLFKQAKDFQKKKKEEVIFSKNAVAIRLEKHSGTFFEYTYGLKKEASVNDNGKKTSKPLDLSYFYFRSLMRTYVEADKDNFITSLIYMLASQSAIIGAIHQGDRSKRKVKLKNFLINRPGYENDTLDPFSEIVQKLLATALKEYSYNMEDYQTDYPPTLKKTIDILKIIKFLNQNNDE